MNTHSNNNTSKSLRVIIINIIIIIVVIIVIIILILGIAKSRIYQNNNCNKNSNHRVSSCQVVEAAYLNEPPGFKTSRVAPMTKESRGRNPACWARASFEQPPCHSPRKHAKTSKACIKPLLRSFKNTHRKRVCYYRNRSPCWACNQGLLDRRQAGTTQKLEKSRNRQEGQVHLAARHAGAAGRGHPCGSFETFARIKPRLESKGL